jgi:ABC-type Fe3+ transport system substrate-binding protein
MGRGKLLPLIILLLLLALSAIPAQPYRLAIYYDGPTRLITQIERAFESYRGDVLEVRDRNTTGPDAAAGADIYWAVGEPGFTWLLPEQLHFYRSSQLGALSVPYRVAPITPSDVEHVVIVYNTDRVSPDSAPSGWDDLLDPQSGRRLVLADPLLDSYALVAMGAIAANLGWDYALSLARTAVVAHSATEAADLVAGQQADVAILPFSQARSRKDAGQPLEIVWPADGAIRVLRMIGIMRKDGRPYMMTGLAEQFVDYVLSAQGQQLASAYGLVPARADVSPPPIPPQGPAEWTVDNKWLLSHREDLRNRLAQILPQD